jgi:hypothetical protein
MLSRLSKVICGLMITMGLVLQPSSARGSFVTILPGYDLLVTTKASFDFGGAGGLYCVDFVGKPIPNPPGTSPGSYDFGSGPVNIGATDTIIRRFDAVTGLADGATAAPINIAMVALSLQSKHQINWSGFGGIANEYVKTVNVMDLGSIMIITNSAANAPPIDEYGTFDSILKIKFQLQGVTSGAITSDIEKTFLLTGGTWTHLPSTINKVPILINGVNSHLNGFDHLNDFFTGYSNHTDLLPPDDCGIHQTVDVNSVPEPTSLFAIGLACMAAGGGFARRRRLQQAT